MRGFNSIFAVSSIEAAKLYYTEFKKQMRNLPETAPTGDPHKLRVAIIYSYGVNEAENDDFVEDENSEDTDGLDKSSRDFWKWLLAITILFSGQTMIHQVINFKTIIKMFPFG